jgi:hypothetical protein
MWSTIKRKTRAAWIRFKRWWIATLTGLGLITVGLAIAETKDFAWDNAIERMDGTPFLAADLVATRIYCDVDPADPASWGAPAIQVLDGSTAGSADFSLGPHSCFGTHVDTDAQESDASNVISFVVKPSRPRPPILRPVPPN